MNSKAPKGKLRERGRGPERKNMTSAIGYGKIYCRGVGCPARKTRREIRLNITKCIVEARGPERKNMNSTNEFDDA